MHFWQPHLPVFLSNSNWFFISCCALVLGLSWAQAAPFTKENHHVLVHRGNMMLRSSFIHYTPIHNYYKRPQTFMLKMAKHCINSLKHRDHYSGQLFKKPLLASASGFDGIVARHQPLQGILLHHPIQCHLVASCCMYNCFFLNQDGQ